MRPSRAYYSVAENRGAQHSIGSGQTLNNRFGRLPESARPLRRVMEPRIRLLRNDHRVVRRFSFECAGSVNGGLACFVRQVMGWAVILTDLSLQL